MSFSFDKNKTKNKNSKEEIHVDLQNNRQREKEDTATNVESEKVYLDKNQFQEMMKKNKLQTLKGEYMKMLKDKLLSLSIQFFNSF